MNVEIGKLYFISNDFYALVNDKTIPQNDKLDRLGKHGRPCFCAIKCQEGYYWLVPISHQIDKYNYIKKKAIKKYGRCDTIEFGFVLGERRAFLIQNMFPIPKKFIQSIYVDRYTEQPVKISNSTYKKILRKVHKVLSLYQSKKINLMFTDVSRILEIIHSMDDITTKSIEFHKTYAIMKQDKIDEKD